MAEIPRALEMLQLGDRAESAGSRQAPQRRTAIGSNGKHARICTSWRMNGKIPRLLEMLQLGDRAESGSWTACSISDAQRPVLRAATADPVSSWSCHSGDHVLATPSLYAIHKCTQFGTTPSSSNLALWAFAATTYTPIIDTACLRISHEARLKTSSSMCCSALGQGCFVRSHY